MRTRRQGVLRLTEARGASGPTLPELRAARARVRALLPGWRGAVRVEVPATPAQYARLLGVADGEYAAAAAVTVPARAGRGARVVTNPAVFPHQTARGRAVVLTHELVHVATGAQQSPAPGWLTEGFADYVALRGTGWGGRRILRAAVAHARRHGLPRGLPSARDFAGGGRRLEAAYERSWLACDTIARAVGERGLVRFYRAVDDGRPVVEALSARGLSHRYLRERSRARLAALID